MICLTFFVNAYTQVTTFSKTIDLTGPGGIFMDSGKQIVTLPNEDLVISAFGRYYDSDYNDLNGASITKIDKYGEVIWSKILKTINPPNTLSVATPNGLISLNDNTFMLSGGTGTPSTSTDFFIMKVDSLGKKLWFKRHGTTLSEHSQTGGIVLTNNGFTFLGDRGTFNDLPSWNIYLVQMDSLGNVLWQQLFGMEYEDGSCLVYPAKVREGYVAGCYLRISKVPIPWDYPDAMFIYGLDEEGEILWEHPFIDDPGFKAPNDFVVLEDGSIVVVGYDENVPQLEDEENTFNIRESYGWMAKLDKDSNKAVYAHLFSEYADFEE